MSLTGSHLPHLERCNVSAAELIIAKVGFVAGAETVRTLQPPPVDTVTAPADALSVPRPGLALGEHSQAAGFLVWQWAQRLEFRARLTLHAGLTQTVDGAGGRGYSRGDHGLARLEAPHRAVPLQRVRRLWMLRHVDAPRELIHVGVFQGVA